MSTPLDLERARLLYLKLSTADEALSKRAADVLLDYFGGRALERPSYVVMEAAKWAASMLNQLTDNQLRAMTDDDIVTHVKHSDCPLCFGNRGGFGSPGTPVNTPPVPEGVLA